MKNGKSFIDIYTITALNDISNVECPIQRTILHEMGHGFHLNKKMNIDLNKNIIKKFISEKGYSSYYASTKKTKNSKINEEIADAISMVSFKNKLDKSAARIIVPKYDKNGKIEGYEILNYEEWHNRFKELANYLENALGL